MFMDGIFPDTVASIRRLNEIKTSLVVMTLFVGVHPYVGATAPPHLTSYPESASDGADFTLSCTPAQGRILISVKWYRNNVNIFDTSSDADASAAILHPLTTSPEYQSVSGRISVSSSLQQHNVTLRTNSPLDQGSVWRCQVGSQFSNNLTIEVKESIRGPSLPALSQTSGGQTVTLTCAGEPGSGGYISIAWYRNGVEIFKTISDDPTVIHSPVNTSSECQSVSGRISVSSSIQQHKVTLRINSTLDQGSVWTCRTGQQFSNNISIEVKESIQVSISVYATKHPGTDEQILKLTCEGADDITETVWSRNSVNIFQTTLPRSMLVYDTDSPEYQSVSGRISVSSSLQQHNVTLRTNSTLDKGSVWRCKVGQQFSNNITVELKESMQEDPVTTIGAIVSPSASEDGNILPITAVAGSIIVAIVIVVAIATSVLLVRKYKQDKCCSFTVSNIK
ncbi:uncharacterized protein LOC124113532 [Haliotis rufescens]|uniref:uncharacterized protein LOC124113532 n=1 Tax=Haliotis rufescens TaxID=6454 RepID=UPI00201E7FA1|nr:uncharacterized protein LOC124113532 [Haliotis rufescens]